MATAMTAVIVIGIVTCTIVGAVTTIAAAMVVVGIVAGTVIGTVSATQAAVIVVDVMKQLVVCAMPGQGRRRRNEWYRCGKSDGCGRERELDLHCRFPFGFGSTDEDSHDHADRLLSCNVSILSG